MYNTIINTLLEKGFKNTLCWSSKYRLLTLNDITTGDRTIYCSGNLEGFKVVCHKDNGYNARRTIKYRECRTWCDFYKEIKIDNKRYYLYINNITTPHCTSLKLPINSVPQETKNIWAQIEKVIKEIEKLDI